MSTTALSNPSARPHQARLFCQPGSLAWPLALVPAWASWRLTGDLDVAVTTLMVIFGAAWQISILLQTAPASASRGARACSAALFVLVGWQLAWIPLDDFWFCRIALPLWGAAWLLLWWGPAGLIWGWRVLGAFVVWGYFCGGPWQWMRDGYQVGDRIGPALSVITAQVAGRLMWYLGSPVKVDGNLIALHGNAVSVGVPCTALPLIKLLWLLLALAALLFRLRLARTLRLAVAAAMVAFAVSIGRVMVLAHVAGDPARFHYWHDAGQGGSEWFTAAAMLAMAWFVARAALHGRPADAGAPEVSLPVSRWALFLGAAGACSIGAALLLPAPTGRIPPFEPGDGHFRIVSHSESWFDQGMDVPAEPNAPAAARRTEWADPASGARIAVVTAYVPRLLSGEPLQHDDEAPTAWGDHVPSPFDHAAWTAEPSGRFASARRPGAVAWMTTVRAKRRPDRWLAWLAHRRPLREKQAFWLEAIWTGRAGQEPSAPPSFFLSWSSTLQSSLP